MLTYLWIGLGGALGSIGRHWLNNLVTIKLGDALPLGTLLVNVTGSFAIGFFSTLTAPTGRWPASDSLRQFFAIGVCGGFTTFSAFSLQTFSLAQEGEWVYASLNILGSVTLCLIAVWLGCVVALASNSH